MTTAQMEVVELIKLIPEERMDNFIQMVKNFVADNNCKMELSESEIRDRKKMEADRRERMALLRRVDWMTALQQEAISIIQSMPYEGVSEILCKSDHRSRHDSIDHRSYTKKFTLPRMTDWCLQFKNFVNMLTMKFMKIKKVQK